MTNGRRRAAIYVILAIAALVVAGAATSVAVLALVVAGNLLLGQREDVPFSTYGMFSKPTPSSWSLGFEDPEGNPVMIGRFGLQPSEVRKKFVRARVAAAESESIPPAEARRQAASVVAGLIDERRERAGELADTPVTITYRQYTLEGGEVASTIEQIGVSEPR